jgi:hypothetical protein
MAHELDPRQMGLLAAGMAMMDPNGGLLAGAQAGMQAYNNALQSNRMRMMDSMQAKKFQEEQELRDFFSQASQPDQSGSVPSTQDIFKKALASGNPGAIQWAMLNAPKLAPKVKGFNKVLDDQGVARYQAMFDNGTFGDMSSAPAAERLAFQDLGAVTAGINPFTGQPVTQMRNSMSPGQQASLAQSAQQFNARMAQDRSQFDQNFNLQAAKHMFDRQQADRPQFKDGFFVTPPNANNPQGQIMETPLSTPPKGSQMDRQRSSEKLMPILNEANRLLNNSTGSLTGAGIDMFAGAFGHATEGAKAAAQLKALEGAIIMAQPRMEGPQSDKDVALYRQMAGMIGDSTVPIETRREALKTIRQLHQQYAGQSSAGQKEKENEPGYNGRKSFIAPNGYSSTID